MKADFTKVRLNMYVRFNEQLSFLMSIASVTFSQVSQDNFTVTLKFYDSKYSDIDMKNQSNKFTAISYIYSIVTTVLTAKIEML